MRLEVKLGLDSRLANIHLSEAHHSVYPFTVTYGPCHSSATQGDAHHTISQVHGPATDRLLWILPEDTSTSGCLSAWSSHDKLVGISETLEVNKFSRQWLRKRHLDSGSRLSRRSDIPMSNASGIDAEGPWFDGVELLKNKEISSMNVTEAKAKSM